LYSSVLHVTTPLFRFRFPFPLPPALPSMPSVSPALISIKAEGHVNSVLPLKASGPGQDRSLASPPPSSSGSQKNTAFLTPSESV